MKNILLTTILLVLSTFVTAQNLITAEKQHKINDYIEYLEKGNQIIGTLSISEKGKEVFHKNFGQKNTDSKGIDIENLRYNIGSISKMFTGVLLAQLEEKGQISYEETLATYFPDMPNAKNIKLKNMLNHTSGLGDFLMKSDGSVKWLTKPVATQAILKEIKLQDTLFDVGKKMQYSNSAYYLVTKILEKKYNQSFKEIVKNQIINPLKMEHTSAYDIGDSFDNVAVPYEKRKNKWETVKDLHFPNVIGVGDMISTTKDLNIFMNALYAGKLIDLSTLSKISPNKGKQFGYGIMVCKFGKNKVAHGHSGGTYGINSLAVFQLDDKLALSYTINGVISLNDFANGILKIIYDKPFKYPDLYISNSDKVDTLLYDSYQGTYESDTPPVNITIFRDQEFLMGQCDGQPSFELTPMTKGKFVFKKAGVVIEFLADKTMLFKQGGHEFIMKKTKKQ